MGLTKGQKLTEIELKSIGTRTLFEWYVEEMRQRTREESQGDSFIKAVEKEIEVRLREYELKPLIRR